MAGGREYIHIHTYSFLGPWTALDYGSKWDQVGAVLSLTQRQKAGGWSPP